ncbi:hypothetical protein GE061_008011 [Apolygus lucorum]|uniref:Reverse transcriptase domain-containing protein n=1 Tax=Apolygus lucorum TaxID=248454 RepID=A0A8S9WPW5_APOLU|nr:hypothetical protein GE061_008011 [Apolygus lucorum]
MTEKTDELEIIPVTLKELKGEIKSNINAKKTPGYDLITGRIMKELPEKAVIKLLHIINATFRLKHVPSQWKVAEVIMITKPGKSPNEKTGYRPISLLPVMSKLFEKLLLKRLKPIIEDRNLIPDHQFGFRQRHSTIDQVHRITNIIEKALEGKKICASIFLDVAQAFDKVWHEGLEYKLHRDLPRQFYLLLKSYLENRHFRVKQDDQYSCLKPIKAGVPQGSVLGPVLYILYTRDLPQQEDTTVATFADDTAILSIGDDVETATRKLQTSANKIAKWTKMWRMKLNETKSVHINFTNRKISAVEVEINSNIIPYADTVKYLGMTLDSKLNWNNHIEKKKQELKTKFRRMYWLMGRNSHLSLHNKLLIYKQILRPIWAYGIQLWGCAKKSNIKKIQTFQNKLLRSIVGAPWYMRNDDIHRDLKIETVNETTVKYARKHEHRLHKHENLEMLNVLDNDGELRRLKRNKPLDLIVLCQ